MSAPKRIQRFRVGYWIERGYYRTVEAVDPAEAERIVEAMLEDGDEAEGATCVHSASGVCDVNEVSP